MIAPISLIQNWSGSVDFIIAFIIGIGFGFVLESAGFGNAKKLAMQFYFRDMTVFKVMFSAIITAMAGVIILSSLGWLDLNTMLINSTYIWSGIAGGLIMGVGFAVGGYCPGTSAAGLATLKLDAAFYIMGLLAGMFVFGEIEPLIDGFYKSGYLGVITLPQTFGIPSGVIGFAIILVALGGFMGSEWLEKRFSQKA